MDLNNDQSQHLKSLLHFWYLKFDVKVDRQVIGIEEQYVLRKEKHSISSCRGQVRRGFYIVLSFLRSVQAHLHSL